MAENMVEVQKTKYTPFKTVVMIVLLLAAGGGAYYWRDNQANKSHKTDQATIVALQKQVTSLEAKSAVDDAASTPNNSTAVEPSAAALESIQASITSDNTAALEGYMAKTVKVVIAASEFSKDRTPTEAISDLKYLDSANDPWDFVLSAATIAKYKTGDYATYLAKAKLIGVSGDKKVVAFSFDNTGKISQVFLAASSDLL